MTDQKDPAIQGLFARAEIDLTPEPFIDDLMTEMNKRMRVVKALKITVGIIVLAIVWMLAGPLQNVTNYISQGFFVPVVEVDNALVMGLLSAVNNISTVVVLSIIASLKFFRRI